MAIESISAEDRAPGRRAANSRRPPLPRRNFRNDCPNPRRRSSRSRCGDKNSAGNRSKSAVVEKPLCRNLVMENVVILKRGASVKNHQEEPKESPNALSVPDLCSPTQNSCNLDNEKDKVPNVYQNPQLYAGSGFITSPPPSSLPHPTSFVQKKEISSSLDLATRSFSLFRRVVFSFLVHKVGNPFHLPEQREKVLDNQITPASFNRQHRVLCLIPLTCGGLHLPEALCFL